MPEINKITVALSLFELVFRHTVLIVIPLLFRELSSRSNLFLSADNQRFNFYGYSAYFLVRFLFLNASGNFKIICS